MYRPAAGKPFWFWLQPHICFRETHPSRGRKRNSGLDVLFLFFLLFVQDTPTPDRNDLKLDFMRIRETILKLRSRRRHKKKEGENECSLLICLSLHGAFMCYSEALDNQKPECKLHWQALFLDNKSNSICHII